MTRSKNAWVGGRATENSRWGLRRFLLTVVFFARVMPTAVILTAVILTSWGQTAWGQAAAPDDDAIIAELSQPPPAATEEPGGDAGPTGIDLITLAKRGGVLMWPIGFMSILVVALVVERIVSFRRNRMVPRRLTRRLGQLIKEGVGNLDAEAAYVACRENRSAAATVIAAMLLRAGRPLGEIEQAGNEAAQRQADDHAGPIRWLNLAAAATPLMGLLGTVWGMIIAFHESSTLSSDRSRSEQLSEGIYTALVTTLAGLAVAIPAAICAQYLENRLTKLFHKIENLAFSVAPALEHYTGRQRLDADGRLRPIDRGVERGGERPVEHMTPIMAPPVIASSVGSSKTGKR